MFTVLLNKLGKLLLHLSVTLTFIGIVPLIILIYYKVVQGQYANALILCGILLTLIKTNKSVQ